MVNEVNIRIISDGGTHEGKTILWMLSVNKNKAYNQRNLPNIDFIYHYTFFEITKFSKILSKFTLFKKKFKNIVKFRKYLYLKKCKSRKKFHFEKSQW